MFGISLPELLVIFTVVLLVFGPDKLPELAKSLGKLLGQVRKHSDSVRREFYNAVYTPLDNAQTRINAELRSIKNLSLEQLDSKNENLNSKQATQAADPKIATPSKIDGQNES